MTGVIRAHEAAAMLPVQPEADRGRRDGFLRRRGLIRTLRDCPLFASLDDEALTDLAAAAEVRSVRGRTEISAPDEKGPGLCIVRSGALKVCSAPRDGRDVILSLLEPGDFFGEYSGLRAPPGRLRVVALRRSEVAVIPRQVFSRWVDREPAVLMACLQATARRVRQAETALRRLALLSVHDRVEDTLRQMADEEGEPHPAGRLIRRRPSQSLLAGLAGSTRETVSRALRDLEERGVIACDGRRVLVRDRAERGAA
jgi:CRP/FNR family cyclic AMP-dependent transcriptional regulator